MMAKSRAQRLKQRARRFADRRPGLFAGIWFTSIGFLLAFLLGIWGLGSAMFASIDMVQNLDGFAWLKYIGYSVVALVITFVSIFLPGATIGRKIPKLGQEEVAQATVIGALTVFAATLLWLFLVDGIPYLMGGGLLNGCLGGDVPGAAAVLAVMIGYPMFVLGGLAVGAILGAMMHDFLNPPNLNRSDPGAFLSS